MRMWKLMHAGKAKDYMYEHWTPFQFIALVRLIQKAPLLHPLSVEILYPSMSFERSMQL